MTGGLNYIAALEAAEQAISNVSGDAAPEHVSVEAQNEASLAEFEKRMAGLL